MLGRWLPRTALCRPSRSTNYSKESGGQTALALAFGSVTPRLGGKFQERLLMGPTQLHSFKSPFPPLHSPNLSACLRPPRPVFLSPPPAFPMFLISFLFLCSLFSLFVQTQYNNSLLALAKPGEGDGKKSNKHKPPLPLDSAVVPEMLFKRDTWSIFPFHLDALPLLFLPLSNIESRCSCLFTLPPDPSSWEREG